MIYDTVYLYLPNSLYCSLYRREPVGRAPQSVSCPNRNRQASHSSRGRYCTRFRQLSCLQYPSIYSNQYQYRVYRVPALKPIIGRRAVPDVDQPARLPRRCPAYSRRRGRRSVRSSRAPAADRKYGYRYGTRGEFPTHPCYDTLVALGQILVLGGLLWGSDLVYQFQR